MKPRTRYILIAIWITLFAVLAPLIIFYVRGLKIDTDNNTTKETGIISIVTDPEDANIYLDDILVGESPEVLRFIEAGDHIVKIEKSGYRIWEKRVVVQAGKVTEINGNGSELFLFKESGTPTEIDTGVNSFVLSGNSLLYTAGNSLVRVEGENFDKKELSILPESGYEMKLTANGSMAILRNGTSALLYSFFEKNVLDLSSALGNSNDIEVLSSGLILALEKNTLSVFNGDGKNKRTLFKNVSAFATFQNNVYAITTKTDKAELLFINTDETLTKLQQLYSGLPLLTEPKLYINSQKSLYVLAGGTLYKLSSGLENLAQGVKTVNINQTQAEAIFTTTSELSVYDQNSGKVTLVSRSGTGFGSLILRQDLGYAFAALEGQLMAIELDGRDKPSTYALLSTSGEVSPFITSDAERIFAVNKGVLQVINIH